MLIPKYPMFLTIMMLDMGYEVELLSVGELYCMYDGREWKVCYGTNSYIGGWWIFIDNQKVIFPSLWLSNAPNNLLM